MRADSVFVRMDYAREWFAYERKMEKLAVMWPTEAKPPERGAGEAPAILAVPFLCLSFDLSRAVRVYRKAAKEELE